MEINQEFDKYAKAKIEDPTLYLPEAMRKVNVDPSSGQLCYMKIFEEDTRRAQHLADACHRGAKLDRKIHRIRNMELCKAIGQDFEDMLQIHRASKATIGLVVDPESDSHTHSFIDIVGTIEEVKMAEELILDKILKTYTGMVFPVILMPPTIYGHEVRIHVSKVGRLVGDKNSNILAMEVVSGAWFQIDNKPPPGCPKHERVLSIYGPKTHVVKAVSLVNSTIYEPGESIEAEQDLENLYRKLSIDEVMKGMKPRSRDIIEHLESSKKKLLEEAKHYKQQLQVNEAASSGSASGFCQAEDEKEQQQHEEDVEGSQDELKDKKQQNEEVVNESQSEKETKGQLQVNEDAASGSAISSRQVEEKKQQQPQKHEEDVEGSRDESKDKEQQLEEDVEGSQDELKDKKQQNEEDVKESQDELKDKKQQNEQDVKGSQDESKDKKQQNEEDVKESEDESKDKKQQNEEDVKEDQSEKEKQQHETVKEASLSPSASGSCQADEEKHEENVEGSRDESKDKTQKDEEDVKEDVPVETSQQ